jgi:hypothetical protein
MATFLHGTTYESIQNIRQHGFSEDKRTVWDCSRDDMLYCRISTMEDAEYLCISNAQITAAHQNSKETKLGLLVIDIPDNMADDLVEIDDSCENMDDCYQIPIEDLNKAIKTGKVKISCRIFKDAYVPYLRPFYLADIFGNPYITFEEPMLVNAIKELVRSETFLEDIRGYGPCINEFVLAG